MLTKTWPLSHSSPAPCLSWTQRVFVVPGLAGLSHCKSPWFCITCHQTSRRWSRVWSPSSRVPSEAAEPGSVARSLGSGFGAHSGAAPRQHSSLGHCPLSFWSMNLTGGQFLHNLPLNDSEILVIIHHPRCDILAHNGVNVWCVGNRMDSHAVSHAQISYARSE